MSASYLESRVGGKLTSTLVTRQNPSTEENTPRINGRANLFGVCPGAHSVNVHFVFSGYVAEEFLPSRSTIPSPNNK